MDLYEQIKKNKKNVSSKDLAKLLVAFGFDYRGTRGDHEQYKKPGFRPFPVPINQNPVCIRIVQNAIRLIEEIIENDDDTFK